MSDDKKILELARYQSKKRRPPAPPYDGPLPTIRVVDAEIPRVVDQGEAALLQANRGLYQRSNAIVAIAECPAKAAHGCEVSELSIVEHEDHALLEDLAVSAHFERFDKRSAALVPCPPPLWIVQTLRARKGRLKFPILSGVISAPTMRADGSILQTPGYDDATGLFFAPRGATFREISASPTRREAEDALARLNGLIEKFPFVDEASRSVALSAFLTAVVRPSLPAAPLHAISATAAGSGKSLLVKAVGTVALGHATPVISPGADEAEFEKRLGAALLAGRPMIAIDNVSRPLEGDCLCSILTSPTIAPRVLGRSEAPTLSTSAFISATGNGLTVKGDLVRRTLNCRLDAGMETPETRTFDFDPVDLARERRADYVAAILTVLRAWHVADRPDAPPALGSFEEWSSLVRGSLTWLGEADPVETMLALRQSDPERESLLAVMAGWRDLFGADRITVASVIRKAGETGDSMFGSALAQPEFRAALLTVAGRAGVVDNKRLGMWLRAHEGRPLDGSRFIAVGVRDGATAWALQSV